MAEHVRIPVEASSKWKRRVCLTQESANQLQRLPTDVQAQLTFAFGCIADYCGENSVYCSAEGYKIIYKTDPDKTVVILSIETPVKIGEDSERKNTIKARVREDIRLSDTATEEESCTGKCAPEATELK